MNDIENEVIDFVEHQGSPPAPLIIIGSWKFANSFCSMDCNPRINVRDRNVIVISCVGDLRKLRGRRFDVAPMVVDTCRPGLSGPALEAIRTAAYPHEVEYVKRRSLN